EARGTVSARMAKPRRPYVPMTANERSIPRHMTSLAPIRTKHGRDAGSSRTGTGYEHHQSGTECIALVRGDAEALNQVIMRMGAHRDVYMRPAGRLRGRVQRESRCTRSRHPRSLPER